jgi:hypothetical protein
VVSIDLSWSQMCASTMTGMLQPTDDLITSFALLITF